MIPSKTMLPLNCSTSLAHETERSNSAYGSAGEIVVQRNEPFCLKRFMIWSVGAAPCSMESTPPSSATRTPSVDSTCAATGKPSSWARSHTAHTMAGSILSSPGVPFSLASSTPPVIMSLMRSAPCERAASTWARASSMPWAAMATDPAMWPPGTEMPSLAARMRGASSTPAAAASRTRVSKSPRPPTVRMVVTPLCSSRRAYSATKR